MNPRLCGADCTIYVTRISLTAVSPQMRGGQHTFLTDCQRQRGIPADAGRTSYVNTSGYINGRHPRRCGADLPCQTLDRFSMAASPHLRGGPNLQQVPYD